MKTTASIFRSREAPCAPCADNILTQANNGSIFSQLVKSRCEPEKRKMIYDKISNWKNYFPKNETWKKVLAFVKTCAADTKDGRHAI
ncbi:MAG: hypothetical protein Q8O57_00885, partial [Kiritimatiellota bacterium]|nr:hypothetical protein [Kiritimatiellota bacterium]